MPPVPHWRQSAYRSEARQGAIFADWVRTSGPAEAQRFSARPDYRYVGREVAAHVQASGLTPRAWLWARAQLD